MYPSPVKIYIHAIKFRHLTLSTLVLKICRGRFKKNIELLFNHLDAVFKFFERKFITYNINLAMC